MTCEKSPRYLVHPMYSVFAFNPFTGLSETTDIQNSSFFIKENICQERSSPILDNIIYRLASTKVSYLHILDPWPHISAPSPHIYPYPWHIDLCHSHQLVEVPSYTPGDLFCPCRIPLGGLACLCRICPGEVPSCLCRRVQAVGDLLSDCTCL